MNVRGIAIGVLALMLAGCETTGVARNAVEARWNGQQAGSFFAKFGPPANDMPASGGSTVYSWRGGYKARVIPAVYEDLGGGKKGKLLRAARTEYARCELQLTVSPDYVIRSIRTLVDKPGIDGGKTYCEELLGGA